LVDNGCNIWNGDAYKNYLIECDKIVKSHSFSDEPERFTQEEFINNIKTDDEFANKWGELGPIYGAQWRNWKGFRHGWHDVAKVIDGSIEPHIDWLNGIDQITSLIYDLKTNPDSRRLMVNAWNVGELDQMVLPPCHYGFQIYTRELSDEERIDWMRSNKSKVILPMRDPNVEFSMDEFFRPYGVPKRAISLMWNQRSCDFPLGIPFNIASYGLLLEIIAKEVNMVPDELIGNLGDCHIYLNQIEGCKEQIGRKYTHEERTELLKQAMGEENYNKVVDELMPFGGGLSEYYDSYKIPYTTREPYKLPRLKFSPCPITGIDMEYQSIAQFQIENYESHPTIKYPLSN
jgi:thymidylate synthase